MNLELSCRSLGPCCAELYFFCTSDEGLESPSKLIVMPNRNQRFLFIKKFNH